jgi:hypothetical protein
VRENPSGHHARRRRKNLRNSDLTEEVKMKRLLKMILLTAVVLALFGASYHYVTAQDEHTQQGSAPLTALQAPVTNTIPPPVATNHVLQRTYLSSGNFSSTFFPAGNLSPLDSAQTIQCPGTSGTCTITAEIWAETGRTTTTGSPNDFSLCAEVDGNFLQSTPVSGCFFAANTPDDNSFVTGTRTDSGSGFLHGNHTIQSFLFTVNGAPVQQFNILYKVYKP